MCGLQGTAGFGCKTHVVGEKRGKHTHGGSSVPSLFSYVPLLSLFLSPFLALICSCYLSPSVSIACSSPYRSILLSSPCLFLLCPKGTHFIFLVHIHILVQLLNFYLLIIMEVSFSLCAADFWCMGGTAAPDEEREKLPIMFPLWVSMFLLPSVSFSAPQSSGTDQFHRLSIYNNKLYLS